MNLTARQPHRASHHVVQAITSEGLVQGPTAYMVARVGFEPVTWRTQGTEPTTEPPCLYNILFKATKKKPATYAAIEIVSNTIIILFEIAMILCIASWEYLGGLSGFKPPK